MLRFETDIHRLTIPLGRTCPSAKCHFLKLSFPLSYLMLASPFLSISYAMYVISHMFCSLYYALYAKLFCQSKMLAGLLYQEVGHLSRFWLSPDCLDNQSLPSLVEALPINSFHRVGLCLMDSGILSIGWKLFADNNMVQSSQIWGRLLNYLSCVYL